MVMPANVWDSMFGSDKLQVDAVEVSSDATAADNLETMLDGTGGQVLSLKQLNVVNTTGSAIVATSSGSNGAGIVATGNGSGAGVQASGGGTGAGVLATGGGTSGQGVAALSQGGGSPGILAAALAGGGAGLVAQGEGAGPGAYNIGGATGAGLACVGGATSGAGVVAAATAGNSNGATFAKVGTGADISGDIKGIVSKAGPITGAVTTDAGNSATAFETDLASVTNDLDKDMLLVITSGTLLGQIKKVTGYVGGTKIITVSGGFTGTPADGVTFALLNG